MLALGRHLSREHFKQCFRIDISRAQIKEAQESASSMAIKENVKLLVGDAAELALVKGFKKGYRVGFFFISTSTV